MILMITASVFKMRRVLFQAISDITVIVVAYLLIGLPPALIHFLTYKCPLQCIVSFSSLNLNDVSA